MLALRALQLKSGGAPLMRMSNVLTERVTQQGGAMVMPVAHKRIYGPEKGLPAYKQHWSQERILSIALLPIMPLCVAMPNPILDTVAGATIILHTHWGFQGVCTDYIHGEFLGKAFSPVILAFSIVAFGALTYFNYADVGLGKACQMVYSQI